MSNPQRLRISKGEKGILERGVQRIRREMNLPAGFPAEVLEAAERAAKSPRLPNVDRTDIPFVTIDPPESRDLDQALHLERRKGGFRLHYAIADVAAWVLAGDPVDIEANRRGETLYGADARISLYPEVLSAGVASLLPDQTCPALLWTIELDSDGAQTGVNVHRAMIRSRAKLSYEEVQHDVDSGNPEPMWHILREIGELRIEREARRGAVRLDLPEQEIHVDLNGEWKLDFRGRYQVELWNEQLSLLTGMAAAGLMVEAGVGLLRTLPEPPDWAVQRLHRTAKALDIDWPDGQRYAEFISALDGDEPSHMAMMNSATSVLRGSGYVAFNGQVPRDSDHSALAAQYSHATAPLRRLVDRYVGETCVAIRAGKPVPDWVLGALPGLPSTMRESGQRVSGYERALVSLAESVALAPHIGEVFDGVIVDRDRDEPERGDVMLHEPAVEAPVRGRHDLPLGARVRVRLVKADPETRGIRFALID